MAGRVSSVEVVPRLVTEDGVSLKTLRRRLVGYLGRDVRPSQVRGYVREALRKGLVAADVERTWRNTERYILYPKEET